ncbi:MAG: CPBP family intramembrane metalloprotease [Bacteroidales bacterium]|nr:CPBP family intramembrane metalloprotease [Bacteroidales bacterium]
MDNIIEYLSKPIYHSDNAQLKWPYFVALFFFYLAINLPLGFFMMFVVKAFHLHHDALKFSSFWSKALIVALLAPVYEEIIFRSWLKLKKINVILILVTLSVFVVMGLFHSKFTFVSIVFVFLLGFSVLLLTLGRRRMENFVAAKFKYFFYASVLIFGLVHAMNFTGNPWVILAFAPLLGSPQLILGYILGYIRVQNGLVYSMLFHMSVNALSVLFFIH